MKYSKDVLANLLELFPEAEKFQVCLYKHYKGQVNTPREKFWLKRNKLLEKSEKLSSGKKADWALAISSLVCVKKDICHIPQIDFRCPVNKEVQLLIESSLKNIKAKGFLVVSGKSYHFYGSKLLNREGWLKFLGLILRFNNPGRKKYRQLVDERWIGANLVRRMSTLRISTGRHKKYLPAVLKKI